MNYSKGKGGLKGINMDKLNTSLNREKTYMKVCMSNMIAWCLCLISNLFALLQKDVHSEENLFLSIFTRYMIVLEPAKWTYKIYIVEHILLLLFIIYQSLPDQLIKSRNNRLIQEKIGYLLTINMLLNAVWPWVFLFDSKVCFSLSYLVAFSAMATGIFALKITLRARVNLAEIIILRVTLSLLSSCGLAMLVVNTSFALKAAGLDAHYDFNEEIAGLVLLVITAAVFNTWQAQEQNTLTGVVFIWFLFGINSHLKENEKMMQKRVFMIIQLEYIMDLHMIITAAMTALLIRNYANKKCRRGILF